MAGISTSLVHCHYGSRAIYSYTDAVTSQQLVFVGGGSSYTGGYNVGIFTGCYNYASHTMTWNSTPDGGTGSNVTGGGSQFSCTQAFICRIQGMASCSGHLYATWFDQLWERRDAPSPSWTQIYRYPNRYPLEASSTWSGFRGLTCVENPNGAGDVLIASLEGPGDIYKFPTYSTIQLVTPTIELHMNNWLGSQLGYWVSYSHGAWNNTMPSLWATGRPDVVTALSTSEIWWRQIIQLLIRIHIYTHTLFIRSGIAMDRMSQFARTRQLAIISHS